MVFATDELSPYDAAPLELYEFVGTSETWRLTTNETAVTSSGATYTPVPGLKRNALKVGTQEEESLALDITIPFDHPIVSAYAYQTAPPTLQLNLYRAHRSDPNDTILMWSGKVLSFSVEGRIAKLRVPSLFAYILQGVAPTPRYQAPCNHVLYDSRCQVNPASYQHATTVASVASNIVQVASFPFATGACNGGEITYPTTGERRMIIGNVGTSLTLSYPFADLPVGANVTLFQGCDHSFTTCKAKFSNGANFGGCPVVPDRNPFTSKL